MKRLLIATLYLSALAMQARGAAEAEDRTGNKFFKDGKYTEAADHYRRAEVEAPEKKALSYNLGNALYKAGDMEQALKSYERAQNPGDKQLRKKVLFNKGNAYY